MTNKSEKMPEVPTLIYDIETTPVRAYIWRTGKQHVNHDQIMKGEFTKIICIAYRWAHEKKTRILKWNNKKQDCEKLIDDFTKIVEKAAVCIAHNGDAFDMKHINTQRLIQGKDPIAWPTSEDTLKQIRQKFWFPSYRLDYICKFLFKEGKSPMNFQDWIDIVEHKSEKALNKMAKYCKRDVDLLFKAWKKVQPHLTPRVGRQLFSEDGMGMCPSCGSSDCRSKGKVYLKAGVYRRYICKTCRHSFRGRKKISS